MSEAVAATDTSQSGTSVNKRRHIFDGIQADDMHHGADCQSVLAPARASELDPRSACRLGSRSFQPRFAPDARRFCLLLDPTPAPERRNACHEFAFTHACACLQGVMTVAPSVQISSEPPQSDFPPLASIACVVVAAFSLAGRLSVSTDSSQHSLSLFVMGTSQAVRCCSLHRCVSPRRVSAPGPNPASTTPFDCQCSQSPSLQSSSCGVGA